MSGTSQAQNRGHFCPCLISLLSDEIEDRHEAQSVCGSLRDRHALDLALMDMIGGKLPGGGHVTVRLKPASNGL
jgi:hypothetical protein